MDCTGYRAGEQCFVAFYTELLVLTYRGPAKSTLTIPKGGDSVIRSLGRGAVICCTVLLPFKGSTRVSHIPGCITWSWMCLMSISDCSVWLEGKLHGCCSLKLKSGSRRLRPTQTKPFSSWNSFRSQVLFEWNVLLSFHSSPSGNHVSVSKIQCPSASATSSAVSFPCFLSFRHEL